MFYTWVADCRGNIFYSHISVFQKRSCFLHPDICDLLAKCLAGFFMDEFT